MRRLFVLLCVVGLFSISLFGQSGRKVVPKPTPEADAETPADEYSESTPQPTRLLTRPQLRSNTGSGGSGQMPNTSPASADGEDIVKVETDLVTIPVSVFDRNGLYIPNLRKSDFKIFENGKEQDIAYFGTTDKPFTVVLLIDVSPSTAYKIEEIQRAATAFVDQLEPQDSVMVIEFDSRVHVLTEVTRDRQQIYKAIRKTGFGDGTSLYEAVHFSIMKRLNGIEGRKAVVLFTDGVDTSSRRATYDTTLDDAEECDSLFFPIYYNTFFDTLRQGGGAPMPPDILTFPRQSTMRGSSAADYALGKKYLEDLAAYTGGRVFRPESTPGGLTAAFEGIAEELRRQYNIGFVPKDEGKPGERKQIKVRVNRPNLIVRSRDSYIVGVQSTKAAGSN